MGAIGKVYFPGYNPNKIEVPDNVATYSKLYADEAKEIRPMPAR